MCALPLEVSRQDSRESSGSGFWKRLEALEAKYRDLWLAVPDSRPIIGPRTTWWRRATNYRHCRRLLDWLIEEVQGLPEDGHQSQEWRDSVKQRVQQLGEERLDWPESYRELVVSDQFYESTIRFIRRARAFDSEICGQDIGQALRNVWIVNSLQALGERPIELNSAVFAYSMLYPYTDNYLDNPRVRPEQKRSLNQRLTCWLGGQTLAPADRHQRKVFLLVEMIAEHYDRHRFPSVFRSVQAIHRAQNCSLRQHRSESPLSYSELLAISVAKGGASVLADGYLADGHLEPAEEDFCMGYGVFLQFLDDLQDVQDDLQAGHETLFTQAARRGTLDDIAGRLYHFMQAVMSQSKWGGRVGSSATMDLILRNCTSLLVGGVAASPDLFSCSFRRDLERRWSLSLWAMKRLERRLDSRARSQDPCHLESQLDLGQ